MSNLRGAKVFLIVLSILMFAAAYSQAGNIPQVINYSGTLTNTDGTPANGNYNMEFKIYNAASGGVALWTEKWDATTSQVTVVNGGFNVMLGNFSQIPMSFFEANPTAFLGIKVGTDSEMMPRQQITSVGYSFTAGNGIPKGGIIMWSGSFAQIPYGWGLCDGLEKTAPDGTKVTPPDLQNRFIVGAGSAYEVGAMGGATTHNISHTHSGPNHQHGITGNDLNHYHGVYGHTHNYSGTTSNNPAGEGADGGNGTVANSTHSHTYSGTTDGGTGHTTNYASEQGYNLNHNHNGATGAEGTGQTGAGGATALENRPPYFALAFIMKL